MAAGRERGGQKSRDHSANFRANTPPSDLPHPAAGQTGSRATLMAGELMEAVMGENAAATDGHCEQPLV